MAEMPLEELIQQIEEEMLHLNQSVRQLKDQVAVLTQENNRLRMQHYDAIDAITLSQRDDQADSNETDSVAELARPKQQELKGKDRLQSFYDEGIHVCHPYFGTKRDPQEACIFCQDILDSLGDS